MARISESVTDCPEVPDPSSSLIHWMQVIVGVLMYSLHTRTDIIIMHAGHQLHRIVHNPAYFTGMKDMESVPLLIRNLLSMGLELSDIPVLHLDSVRKDRAEQSRMNGVLSFAGILIRQVFLFFILCTEIFEKW